VVRGAPRVVAALAERGLTRSPTASISALTTSKTQMGLFGKKLSVFQYMPRIPK
jgi:hypothetical protein